MGGISLREGAGGRLMEDFLKKEIFSRIVGVPEGIDFRAMDDSGTLGDISFTIDAFTVFPPVFPGGTIGRLAVSGTVNDLLCIGSKPLALSISLVIEEGFEKGDLRKILEDLGNALKEAGVGVLAGDTKVIPRGGVEGILITASGIGSRDERIEEYSKELGRKIQWLLDSNARPGDHVIISGYIGDHGIAIMKARGEFSFETNVKSDVAPLLDVYEAAISCGGVFVAKDPTRGGVAEALNEISIKSGYGIEIEEERLPIREEVRSACEFLGIDPLELGNEGKMILVVSPEFSEEVLKEIRKTKNGRNAEIIGKVTDKHRFVVMNTEIGGKRIVDRPLGDPVPRIC